MRFAAVRLLLALLFLIPAVAAEQAVVIFTRPRIGPLYANVLSAIAACVLGWCAYAAYARLAERRPPSALTEFGRRGALAELAAGLAIGAAVFGASLAVLAALGLYKINGTRELSVMIIPLAQSIGAGVIEEILFRGAIFRIVESSLGTWFALLISSALFGLVHLGNPHATVFGAVAIIFEAGIMLAGAYLLTRRLWLAIGIHIGWNFTQGGVFSVPVSGTFSKGYFDATLSGPEWLSGGVFGVEASVVAVVLCVLLGVALLRAAALRGHFIAPRWRRVTAPESPAPAEAPSPITAR